MEESDNVQYRKEGVFLVTKTGEEYIGPVEYRVSDLCLRDGITWDWFGEGWAFGNGVTVHKTLGSPEFRTVVHGTDLTLDQFLTWYGATKLADLELERMHVRHEGWEKYEARWLPGACPQENHIVHLTWLVSKHRLPPHAYRRLQGLIEDSNCQLKEPQLYSRAPGEHFSETRQWEGARVGRR